MKNKNRKEDKSIVIPQRDKIGHNLNIYQRPDLTENQKKFLQLALDKNTKIMFVSGPAGTSKTYCAILAALQLLNEKKVSDLIYIRSAVESSDSKLGFLPGDQAEKMAPYIQPLLDKLEELLPKEDIYKLHKDQRINGIPINFLRGQSWNAKVVVADEMQNCTTKEIVTLITRFGNFSKLFILGDPQQSDINGKSGFTKISTVFSTEMSKYHGIHFFEFTKDDIVRSELVKFIIETLQNAAIIV